MRLNYIDNIDCLEGLAAVPDNSVDLIVTDPPYFLNDFQSQTQSAVALDLCDHTTESIRMGSKHQTVIGIFAAKIDQDTAFGGDPRIKAQNFKSSFYPL